jgi:CysZ protein
VLFRSGLIFRRKRLFGWSLLLVVSTIVLTWIGYELATSFVDQFASHFLASAPEKSGVLGWIKYAGWTTASWLYTLVSRIVAFYLAFLVAYTLTTPGYGLLSASAEKIYTGGALEDDAGFSMSGIFIDIFEGCKIAVFGVFITLLALFINFLPGIGQLGVLFLYTYYNALMFIDFSASRRRWSLGRKIGWLRDNYQPVFRLGLFPAVVTMLPVINIFIIALLFPLFTVHSTLNFIEINSAGKRQTY